MKSIRFVMVGWRGFVCGLALLGPALGIAGPTYKTSNGLPTPPITPVPPGYGNYCSVIFPSGGWAFEFMNGATSDPCSNALSISPSGTIARAGIWSQNGDNNILVRCSQGIGIFRGTGASFINTVFQAQAGKTSCVFIVSPTTLPIFGRPWGLTAGLNPPQTNPDSDVSLPTSFNYDLFNQPWDVSTFGQTPNPSNNSSLGVYAAQVDRYGKEQGYFASSSDCAAHSLSKGCILPSPSGGRTFEGAYDWSMPLNKPLIAVADGIVRGARDRNVAAFNCHGTPSNVQSEVFIETQVGSGQYSENFVAAYHHLVSGTEVQVGQVVKKGQVIGHNGNSGCSGAPHLDLQVFRLTNLTGINAYQFQALPVNPSDAPTFGKSPYSQYGVNGWQGMIDPFGWAAPRNVDPLAWKFIGHPDSSYPLSQIPGLTDVGAFSVNLWIPSETPPMY